MDALSSFYPRLTTSNKLIPRIFGCGSMSMSITVLDENLILEQMCLFVWYSCTQKGYNWYHPPSKNLCLDMSFLFSNKVTFTYIIFKGRLYERKIILLCYLLRLELETGTEKEIKYEKEVQPPKSTQDRDDVRFGKILVYTQHSLLCKLLSLYKSCLSTSTLVMQIHFQFT